MRTLITATCSWFAFKSFIKRGRPRTSGVRSEGRGHIVIERFYEWLDHRTGSRKIRDALLLEHIPGGAKWRYVWGSTLAFVFMIQLVTGVLLMWSYSPGDSTAWGSVYFIQYEMDFGW